MKRVREPVTLGSLLAAIGLILSLVLALTGALATRLDATDARLNGSAVSTAERLTRIEDKLDQVRARLAPAGRSGRGEE